LPDGWRQDELVEQLAQVIRVDVVADVVFRGSSSTAFRVNVAMPTAP
jgi:hypothetical protein